MKQISLALIAALLAVGVSCNRDPKAVAQRYTQNGNRYFDAGKYKEASIMYRKALGKNRLSADAWYRLAQAEMRLGRPGDAVGPLRYSISLNSANTKAHVQLTELYLLSYVSRPDQKLIPEIDSVIGKLKPDTVERHRLEGAKALYIEKDFKKAISEYQAAKAAESLDPELVFPLAQALIFENRADEGEKLARAAIAHDRKFEPLYDILYAFYAKTNRMQDAEAILKLRAANNPKSQAALERLARFYRGAKRYAEMNEIMNRLCFHTADFPNGRLLVGEILLSTGDYQAAIGYLEPGIRSDSKRRAEYRKRIARALLAQNKKSEAKAKLAEVLKDKPDDAEAQSLNAELMIETEPANAAAELEKAVAKLPKDPNTRLNLARALMSKPRPSMGDIEKARMNFEEVLRLAPGSMPARLGLTQALLAKRDLNGAIASANEVLAANPRNAAAKMLRSLGYAQMGRLPQARADLEDVLKQHPQFKDAALQLALVSLAEKNYAEAEQRFTEVYRMAPKELRAVKGLAEAYALRGKNDKALQILQAEAQRQPGENSLLLAISDVAARAGNYDLAMSSTRTLADKDPGSAEAWYRLGQLYTKQANLKTAIDCFRKARSILPENVQITSDLAVAVEQAGQKAEAKSLYEQILNTHPDHPVALNNLAYILAESGGDLDRALMLAQRARQRMPNNPDVADTLGWIYIRKDLSDPAIEIYRQLVGRQPANSTFRYHLGMALYQKGDKPQAKRELQSALQNKPAKVEEGKIRELMAKIG